MHTWIKEVIRNFTKTYQIKEWTNKLINKCIIVENKQVEKLMYINE